MGPKMRGGLILATSDQLRSSPVAAQPRDMEAALSTVRAFLDPMFASCRCGGSPLGRLARRSTRTDAPRGR